MLCTSEGQLTFGRKEGSGRGREEGHEAGREVDWWGGQQSIIKQGLTPPGSKRSPARRGMTQQTGRSNTEVSAKRRTRSAPPLPKKREREREKFLIFIKNHQCSHRVENQKWVGCYGVTVFLLPVTFERMCGFCQDSRLLEV